MNISVEGAVLPNEVFVTIDNFQYKMVKVDNTTFSYTFRNVQKDIEFTLQSGTVISVPYSLEVLEKPNLSDFSIEMVFPAYVGRKNEVLQNTGDIVVPEGTKMTWLFDALQTDDISMYFGENNAVKAEKRDETRFRYTK